MNAPLGRWRGRLLGKPSMQDRVAIVAIVLLGMVTIAFGRRAAYVPLPATAIDLSRMIDDLDAPARLPNAPLKDLAGDTRLLSERIQKQNAVLAFYAPWCRPCQKEVPELIEELGEHADILIVVAQDEDLEHTRRQLSNLDLDRHGALIDSTGQLFREGRVTALPTTYVVNKHGAVRLRSKGYSPISTYRMKYLIAPRSLR